MPAFCRHLLIITAERFRFYTLWGERMSQKFHTIIFGNWISNSRKNYISTVEYATVWTQIFWNTDNID